MSFVVGGVCRLWIWWDLIATLQAHSGIALHTIEISSDTMSVKISQIRLIIHQVCTIWHLIEKCIKYLNITFCYRRYITNNALLTKYHVTLQYSFPSWIQQWQFLEPVCTYLHGINSTSSQATPNGYSTLSSNSNLLLPHEFNRLTCVVTTNSLWRRSLWHCHRQGPPVQAADKLLYLIPIKRPVIVTWTKNGSHCG